MKAKGTKGTTLPPGEGRVAALDVGGHPISLSIHGDGKRAVILGPGAGGTRETPQLVSAAAFLDPDRYTTILFNFPYQEARRRFPDPAEICEQTVAATVEYARTALGAAQVVVGGRSFGGRMASQAVAKGLVCDGVAFLAYPLHPPGQEGKLRDSHLGAIRVPLLFLQGTRDEFARLELLEATVERLGASAELALFQDADHSFKTPRGAAMNSKQTEAAVFTRLAQWLASVTL